MAPITMLRQIVKNGWTIANRKAIISQIGKSNFDEITLLAKKTGRTGDIFRFSDAKNFLRPNEISATKEALTQTNTVYHGSPFLFDAFDATRIGAGEGGRTLLPIEFWKWQDIILKTANGIRLLKKRLFFMEVREV